MIDKAL